MDMKVYHVTDSPCDPTHFPLKKERWASFMATSPERAITYIPPHQRLENLTLIEGIIEVDDEKIITVFGPEIELSGQRYHLHQEASRANYLAKEAGYDIIHVANDFGSDDLLLLTPECFTPKCYYPQRPDGTWGESIPRLSANSMSQQSDPVSNDALLACIEMHNTQADKLDKAMSAVAQKYGIDNLMIGQAFQGLLSGSAIPHRDALIEFIPALPLDKRIQNELYQKLTGATLPQELMPSPSTKPEEQSPAEPSERIALFRPPKP